VQAILDQTLTSLVETSEPDGGTTITVSLPGEGRSPEAAGEEP